MGDLFDKNGNIIWVGDKYIANGIADKIYTVYFKNGAICGGSSFEDCCPLGWDIPKDYHFELIPNTDFSWIEIIND